MFGASTTPNRGAGNSLNLPSMAKPQESAWQRGLRAANTRPSAPTPDAPSIPDPGATSEATPTIAPGLTLAGAPPEPMDPMQVAVPPPALPQALEGLRAAIGQTGGDQYGAQSPPAPVPGALGQRIYPQGGMALAQRLPRAY